MPEPAPPVDPRAPTVDGRRRRGDQRRRALLGAALRVIGRDGLAAITQRAVAAEAGLPPSAVYYYFATLDDLVVAVLVDVNNRFLAELSALPDGAEALRAMAVATVASARRRRDDVLAELELWILGTRHEMLRPELDRWNAGLRAAAAKLTDNPIAVEALVATLNGYYWQAISSDDLGIDHLESILRHVTGAQEDPKNRVEGAAGSSPMTIVNEGREIKGPREPN